MVLTPADLAESLALAAALLSARTVDLLVVDLPDGRDPAVAGVRVGDRLARLAALARRAGTLLVILGPRSLGRGLAAAVEEASGLRLSWSAPVDPSRPGTSRGSAARDDRSHPLRTKDRRAASRILYAEGGVRDACQQRDGLLAGAGPSNRRRRPPPWYAAVPAHSCHPNGPLHRPIAMLLLTSLAHLRSASRGPASSHRERTSAS